MRILVVEDDKKVQKVIKQGLEDEKYLVDVVCDGIIGLEKILNHQYDLIILDVMLPGKDGFTILKELREASISTSVLMLTARDNVEDKVSGLDLGADDYLAKPFALEELVARIRALIRRNSPEKTTKLKCSNLILDTVSHLAIIDNREIELTTKEYALLEYLIRNKNRILSRNTIAQHVWKSELDSESNIIDVYIKRLRIKLGDDNEQPMIQSIRSVGYRIRDYNKDDH